MAFGLTPDGFKIKRFEDILEERRQRYRDEFGDNFDLSDATPEGQQIAIESEREAEVWELAQDTYNSQYPNTAEGKQLDNVVAITGTIREGAEFSTIVDGVARGTNGTILDPGAGDIIFSVVGSPSSRFKITGGPFTIDIPDGPTFKSGPITLIAENSGAIQANTGTLTVIETPQAGLDSFINESDADLGAAVETDPNLKARRDQELQIAGAATIEAIISELSARPLVEAVVVFQNIFSIPDIDGRNPKSLDIVVLGDDEQDLAEAIFLVIGGGAETIGDITKTHVDTQGFDQIIKFSRPTDIPIFIELDITKDPNFYPVDGDNQVQNKILAYGDGFTVDEDVIVKGSTPNLNCSFEDVPGILSFEIRVGKAAGPLTDNNVIIAPREIAKFDSADITITS